MAMLNYTILMLETKVGKASESVPGTRTGSGPNSLSLDC